MKVLFIHYAIVDKEGFGRTFKLAKEIAKLGNEVVFLTTQSAGKFVYPFKVEFRDNVKIISFPDILPNNFRRTGFGIFSSFLKVFYLIKNNNFDIVHSDTGHRFSAAFPSLIMQLVYKKPHVTEWWDYFGRGGQFDEKNFFKKITFGYYDLIMQKPFLKKADGVIVLSDFLKKKAAIWGVLPERTLVLNGGADIDDIKYYESNFEVKRKKNISTESLTLGFVGMNDGEIKDLIPFLEAIECLKNEISVNWFTTGHYIPEKLKREYKIGNELMEFGWQDYNDFAYSISCADAFLLLQRDNIINEARWPNKLGDYLAAGRVVITNPIGELKGLIKEYPNMFIVVDYTKDSIIRKIREIYVNKSKLSSQGLKVREVAEKDMGWNCRAKELFEFYKEVISKSKNT